MKEIDESVLEAAIIDGCNERQKFFQVVLPQLHSSISTVITLSTIYALTMFDIPFMLGGVQVGDKVTIFSSEKGLTLEDMATTLDTISYEIMTSISARVKRIYTER